MGIFHLHLVSDSTGETVTSVARACVVQFDQVQPVEHFWNLIRTERQLSPVIDDIRTHPGLVLYTIVDPALRSYFEARCAELPSPAISVLDPTLRAMENHLQLPSKAQPGRQHMLNAEYFDRIDAVEFALANDDGQASWKLKQASVVLVGVSRTSKTPTCIYLANRGIKAANVPFVPGIPLPPELQVLTGPLIVGLTEDPERLVQIRRNRLRIMNQSEDIAYVDLESVQHEVSEARRYYAAHGWPVIDVTRRSVEETAAEIIKILNRRTLNSQLHVEPHY